MSETETSKKKSGCTIFVFIFLGILALWVIYSSSEDKQAQQTLAVKGCNWEYVDSFQGQGMKTTDKFTINGPKWKVKWSFNATQYSQENAGAGAIFQIYVYDKNGIPQIAGNVTNQISGADESIYHDPGTYYLTISTANVNYSIEILECK